MYGVECCGQSPETRIDLLGHLDDSRTTVDPADKVISHIAHQHTEMDCKNFAITRDFDIQIRTVKRKSKTDLNEFLKYAYNRVT